MKTANVNVRPRAENLLCASALAGMLALSACGHGLPNQGVGQASVARGQAVLMVKPQVIAGGYKAQALVENYKKSDINHLVIKVFELQGGVELPVVDEAGNQVQVDLLNSELDVPVKFSNLFRDTTYRVRCYAYKAPGEVPADLISTLDTSSYIDVPITNDNAPTVAQLRVRLVDVVFNSALTTGVNVTDGGYVNSGTVAVTKESVPVLVTTLAGGIPGYSDGFGSSATMRSPVALTLYKNEIYIVDSGNNALRKADLAGNLSTVTELSNSSLGLLDYSATYGICAYDQGIIYTDSALNRINLLTSNYSNIRIPSNSEDNSNPDYNLAYPTGISIDSNYNIYVCDTLNHRIIIYSYFGYYPGSVRIIGTGVPGFKDGESHIAQFNSPKAICVDQVENAYVADTLNNRIRKISSDGVVTTIAGDGFFSWRDGDALSSQFDEPTGITISRSGKIYVSDTNNNCIRLIHNNTVSTIAGRGVIGLVNGAGNNAEFSNPTGILSINDNLLFIADTGNNSIRKIELK